LQGTVTLRMEEFRAAGSRHTGDQLDGQEVQSRKQCRGPELPIFNLINSGAPITISCLSGTFGRVTAFLRPGLPIGLQFSF
jgi:hypothetical protein